MWSYIFRASNKELRKHKTFNFPSGNLIVLILQKNGLVVTLCCFKHKIYCNICQHLAKWLNLHLVNHKNKQTISGKDKSRNNFKTV